MADGRPSVSAGTSEMPFELTLTAPQTWTGRGVSPLGCASAPEVRQAQTSSATAGRGRNRARRRHRQSPVIFSIASG